MIHRADCRYAQSGHAWQWPENHGYETDKQLRLGIESAGADWLRLAKCCCK
jgi:hypothetical protein